MRFVLVGVNHKTCPLDVREKFFFQSADKDILLAELKSDPGVLAAFVVSTCNRTEIYADLLDNDVSRILTPFFNIKNLARDGGFNKYFYIIQDESVVVQHLFRVVTGLDSLILGEKQILGQVKEAMAASREKQMMNRAFNILANLAVETGKKVRRETQIDFGGASVSWAAISKAQEMLGTLEDKGVLLMGCGKMGFLAAQQLLNKGIREIFVMNRTFEKAEELAKQCGGKAIPFWQIREILERTDVCICSTGAPHYLVDPGLAQRVMAARPGRPLAFIDIAVPRNIDPEVARVEGVSLISVDDLSQALQDNMNKRLAAVDQVERIIRIKTGEFFAVLDKAIMHELLNTPVAGEWVVQ